jgi:hypothetical protein
LICRQSARGDITRSLECILEFLLRALRASLAAFETGASVGKQLLGERASRKARSAATTSRKAARRKPRISAATRATYRLQGKYLSALRPLSKSAR